MQQSQPPALPSFTATNRIPARSLGRAVRRAPWSGRGTFCHPTEKHWRGHLSFGFSGAAAEAEVCRRIHGIGRNIDTVDDEEDDEVGAPETTEDEGADSWTLLASMTAPVDPTQIGAFVDVRPLVRVESLLRSLLGRNGAEFLARAAALQQLVRSRQAAFKPGEIHRLLAFLPDPHRSATIQALRRNGWLDYAPAIGYTITSLGTWVEEILVFFLGTAREDRFATSLAGINYLLEQGEDPTLALHILEERVIRLQFDLESAVNSYSERTMRATQTRVNELIQLSQHVRKVQDRLEPSNRAARDVLRRINKRLAELHWSGGRLDRGIAELSGQYLNLRVGVTSEQFVQGLLTFKAGELAVITAAAFRPVYEPAPLLSSATLARAALHQLGREHGKPGDVDLAEPSPAERQPDAEAITADVARLLQDLEHVADAPEPVALADIVPRESPGESFLRLALLTLAGDASMEEGLAGQLGRLPIDVEVDGDGATVPLQEPPLRALTPGRIRRRSGN